MNGKIIKSGGPELALELEKKDMKILIKWKKNYNRF